MEQTSDAELAQRAIGGDNTAFSELVRRYQNAVYEMGCRMLGSRDAGFDAAQDVFIKVYKSLDKYDQSRKFSTWLLTITRNYCIDQIRKPTRKLTTSLQEENRVPARTSKNPGSDIEQAEAKRLVEKAVEELSDVYKEAIQLYHFQELSYQECADVQGVPIGTFMARLHRARKQLREKLRPVLEVENGYAPQRNNHRNVG